MIDKQELRAIWPRCRCGAPLVSFRVIDGEVFAQCPQRKTSLGHACVSVGQSGIAVTADVRPEDLKLYRRWCKGEVAMPETRLFSACEAVFRVLVERVNGPSGRKMPGRDA